MLRIIKYFFLSLIILCGNLFPQGTLYYTQDTYGKYIDYLINNGSLRLDFPLIKPYKLNELRDQLDRATEQSGFLVLLAEDIYSFDFKPDKLPSGILKGEVNLNLETGPIIKSRNSLKISANYQTGNLAFSSGFHIDQRFKDDSTYFGELGEWYYGRFNESYLSYTDTSHGFYAAYGRVPRNLGYYSSKSLILSDNPYSYDHLWLQFENDIFSFSYLTARIEDKFGYDNRVSDSSSHGWYKRFFSLHRLDLNLTDNFKFALTESVLYGGRNQQWLSYYTNPLVPFYISKNNQRSSTDEGNANIYLALDLWYKPFNSLTLFSQIFIDDIDFKSENRAKYPERKAVFASATVTDYLIPYSQYGISYTWIENWTYNSFYSWANYNIHERGMGFPYNSYQTLQLVIDYFGLQRMILSGRFSYAEKGENSLNSAFGATFENFPMGVVEKAFEINLSCWYYFAVRSAFNFDLRYRDMQNRGNIVNENNDEISTSINFYYYIR